MSRLTKGVKVPLRLMPLGGSITYGQGSSDGNGYRRQLQQLLIQDGYSVQMVGSRNTGTMENNEHEGWRGYRIEQIMNKAARSIAEFKPNVIAVNAGSNDCVQDFEMDGFKARISRLLDVLWEGSPHATILLSTLLVMADRGADGRVCFANEQLRHLVKKNLAEDKRIVYVNMHDRDGPQVSDLLSDGVHPDDAGYEKMAWKWYAGVQEAGHSGFLQTLEVHD